MSKYQPLAEFLADFEADSWEASFSEIERILRFALPPSAREHRAWWANQYRGNHSQARSWIGAGWKKREVDLERERVRFERNDGTAHRSHGGSDDGLWARAAEISGISDRQELERAAATALIQREAARTLAMMGGTMTDAAAAPRARPFP